MQDLFGKDIILPLGGSKKYGERIAVFQYKQLISYYGKMPGKSCRDCSKCVLVEAGSKQIRKCLNAKVSQSQATDWNSRWSACGRFEKK